MSRARKKLFGPSDGKSLPAGYEVMEYLENKVSSSETRARYVETEVVLQKGDVIRLTFRALEETRNSVVYGYRRAGGYTDPYQVVISNATFYNLSYDEKPDVPNRPIYVGHSSMGQRSDWNIDEETQVTIDTAENSVTVNGSPLSSEYDTDNMFNASGSSVYAPSLFNLNIQGSYVGLNYNVYNSIGTRIYAYSVERSGFLVTNLVPARRISDGAEGFYDTARDKFLTFNY